MSRILGVLTITAALMLTGCDQVTNTVTPPPKREVTADGHTYFACEGVLSITPTSSGYDIHLTDRGYVQVGDTGQWKITETEFYLHGVKHVAVAPLDLCDAPHN